MSLETYQSGRIIHVSQNDNREFINLLTCVSTDQAVRRDGTGPVPLVPRHVPSLEISIGLVSS